MSSPDIPHRAAETLVSVLSIPEAGLSAAGCEPRIFFIFSTLEPRIE